MNSVGDYIGFSRVIILLLIVMILLIKLVLYYKHEKEWNSITFFHFNRIQLKLTNSRHLRATRRTQNRLTTIVSALVILFILVSLFYAITSH